MKQCPVCKRTYADERLAYCLEDGTALINLPAAAAGQAPPVITQPSPRVKYSPAPTMRVPPGQFGSAPQIPEAQIKPRGKGWIITALIGLFLILAVTAAVIILIFRKGNNAVVSNTNTPATFTGNNNASENKGIVSVSPLPSSTPAAAQLVGIWKTSVVENKVPLDITVTFNSDGTSKFLFMDKKGRTNTDAGTWQYSEGTLYEHYSNGASGRGSVKWIGNDNVDLTIIDNGVPAYSGVVRHYHRLK